jgi:flavin-dependent thymidylate synthase
LDKKNIYKKVLWVPNPIQSFYKKQAHHKPFKVIYLGGYGYSHDVHSILSIVRKNAKQYSRNGIKFYFFGQGVKLKDALVYASKHKLQNVLKICKFRKNANIISILKKSSLAIASLNQNEIYQYGINLNKINTYFSCGIPFLLHGGCVENEFSNEKLGMRMTSKSCEELSKNIDSFFQIKNKGQRDISRQILRHRSFSFQEFSQRYALVNDFVTRECRLQHSTNRQKSIESDNIELNDEFVKMQNELIQKEIEYYNFCIKNNIAKEQSRVILSEGLTKTRLYMNGTIRSWIHYLQIRTSEDTQKEHRDLAIKIKNEILKIFPIDIF